MSKVDGKLKFWIYYLESILPASSKSGQESLFGVMHFWLKGPGHEIPSYSLDIRKLNSSIPTSRLNSNFRHHENSEDFREWEIRQPSPSEGRAVQEAQKGFRGVLVAQPKGQCQDQGHKTVRLGKTEACSSSAGSQLHWREGFKQAMPAGSSKEPKLL
jgi:hypothetical protein